MSTLEHLVRYESPHSGLAFRPSVYKAGDEAELLADCLALANADVAGQRLLFLGIDPEASGQARLLGTNRRELAWLKNTLRALIADYIEPALEADLRGVMADDRLIAYLRFRHCDSAPYLIKRSFGDNLLAGQGFIRRGAHNYPLQRSDMQRMFARGREAAAASIRVGFPGNEPLARLVLPALPVKKLPSELAAERIRQQLAANDQARELFGATQTRISRLVHAKLYGVETPFEKHGDDTLVSSLHRIDQDYAAADLHYQYEVRAHRVNLMIANDGDSILHDASIRLTLPNRPGIGVAERIYAEDDAELPRDGYPEIDTDARVITLTAEIGALYPGRSVRVFREPARFWAREDAVGLALPVDYELVAAELAMPLRGTLVIDIERPEIRGI